MKAQQIAEVVEKEVKNFEQADEVREFPHGRLELVKIGGMIVGRAKLEPGWKWSEDVKPIVKTDSCEAGHFMYVISGTMRIRMDDGEEFECRAGDVCLIPPGHEAWVVGNEPVEVVDAQGMSIFAESL
jgi:uncharacterized cupin superfamily protein